MKFTVRISVNYTYKLYRSVSLDETTQDLYEQFSKLYNRSNYMKIFLISLMVLPTIINSG